MKKRKKIAIVGTGISGLVAAYKLHKQHDITVFEANGYIGGHTNTVDVVEGQRVLGVDTGFIVHNERTYPRFVELMRELEVPVQESDMSFSLHEEATGYEYNGGSLGGLFAQRRNLLNPAHYRLIRDILRFFREAKAMLARGEVADITIEEYISAGGFSRQFRDYYMVPMGAAIWSTSPEHFLQFPFATLVRFYRNHGLLETVNRPTWKTITGGSKTYVEKMVSSFRDRIRLNTPVQSVARTPRGVLVRPLGGAAEPFDEVVIAAHSDQALAMLEDPSGDEQRILGAIPYQENIAYLHTDASVLPRRRRAWASWNYRIPREGEDRVVLTYNMNLLQDLRTAQVYNVTLNDVRGIDENRIIRTIQYHHPLFTREGMAAQREKHRISGQRHTWYAGAYWRHGFHEDGVVSALDVVEGIEEAGHGVRAA